MQLSMFLIIATKNKKLINKHWGYASVKHKHPSKRQYIKCKKKLDKGRHVAANHLQMFYNDNLFIFHPSIYSPSILYQGQQGQSPCLA